MRESSIHEDKRVDGTRERYPGWGMGCAWDISTQETRKKPLANRLIFYCCQGWTFPSLRVSKSDDGGTKVTTLQGQCRQLRKVNLIPSAVFPMGASVQSHSIKISRAQKNLLIHPLALEIIDWAHNLLFFYWYLTEIFPLNHDMMMIKREQYGQRYSCEASPPRSWFIFHGMPKG